mgnify:CR=1 FL=1
MKTIKKMNLKGEMEYKRVNDSEGNNLTRVGWNFCPKIEWKENIRDFGKTKEEITKVDKPRKEKKTKKEKVA